MGSTDMAGNNPATPQPTEARRSALMAVWQDPLYRGATISMLLAGLGSSAAAPQIASFLVRELNASLSTAGMYYLTSLSAPIAGYLVGSLSDRTGNRFGLFRICAIAGFLGWTAIALATHLWMPFVISFLVLGFAGAAGSQLFAALHDAIQHDTTSDGEGLSPSCAWR